MLANSLYAAVKDDNDFILPPQPLEKNYYKMYFSLLLQDGISVCDWFEKTLILKFQRCHFKRNINN